MAIPAKPSRREDTQVGRGVSYDCPIWKEAWHRLAEGIHISSLALTEAKSLPQASHTCAEGMQAWPKSATPLGTQAEVGDSTTLPQNRQRRDTREQRSHP